MAQSNNKDPKLKEVRAVLQRLQGIDAEGKTDTQSGGADQRTARGAGAFTAFMILGTVAAIFGAAFAFVVLRQPPAPDPSTTVEKPKGPATSDQPGPVDLANLKPALDRALDLMAKGQVRTARERLLALVGGGLPHADVAWALARSYDPNHLVTIPAADATPDVKEATRWYRAWYTAAVRQGLVADSVSLERIINSMGQQ